MSGPEAERNVYEWIRNAAEMTALVHLNLRFFLFHSVKYGIGGTGDVSDKWLGEIDIVLICFDPTTGLNEILI